MVSLSSFGFNAVQSLITADWKLDKGIPFETASTHTAIQWLVYIEQFSDEIFGVLLKDRISGWQKEKSTHHLRS